MASKKKLKLKKRLLHLIDESPEFSVCARSSVHLKPLCLNLTAFNTMPIGINTHCTNEYTTFANTPIFRILDSLCMPLLLSHDRRGL